jgi:glycosyltransferase involved in cell wall biosynthesis
VTSFAHLGINALFLEPKMGGLDVYARELIPNILRAAPDLRVSLYVNERGREHVAREPWAEGVRLVSHPLLGVRGTRAIAELTALGWLAGRDGVDVLHSLALTAPLWTKAANVVTLADITWISHPSRHGAATYRMWRAVVPRVARRADRVIAISEAGAADIAEHLHVPRERIDVTPLGHGGGEPRSATAPDDLRAGLDLPPGPFVLSVGTRKEHKNLGRLVEAMAEVPGASLVLAGHGADGDEELRATAARLGLADRLVLLDFVSDEDLEGLYAAAAGFVLPSLNEGFGLPILEAMRRGVPTATSNVSSLPEVAGDAALQFDPHDVGAIADAIRALLDDEDLRARLAREGPARAAGFTWMATAEATLASYERAWSTSRS